MRSASGIPFRYSRGDRKKHRNSHTFYLAYEGPLPGASPKEVKIDITITERFVLPIEDHVDLAMLMREIDSKLEFRGRSRDAMGEAFEKKEARYKRLWSTRLGSQMAELPSFEDVFRAVRRNLRAAGLIER